MKAPIVALSLLIFTPSAHALINLPSSEIDLTNTLGISYDSNLTGGANGKSDYFVSYSPRLNFIRKAGLIQLQSNVGITFSEYFDQTSLNSQNVSAGLQLTLAEAIRGALSGSLNTTYTETETVLEDINARVHSDSLSFGANGQLQFGRRMSLTGVVTYSNARRSGGSDSETLGANLGWALSDFLRGTALHVDYSYSQATSDANAFSPIRINQSSNQLTAGLSRLLFPNGDTTISANFGHVWLERSRAEKAAGLTNEGGTVFNASIAGPFLPRDMFPKLHSSFSVGYSQSVTPGLNDNGQRGLTGSLALDWQARERTQLGVSVSQSRSLTISNLTAVPTMVDFHISQKLLYNLSANAGVTYSWTTYKAPSIAVAPTSPVASYYASSFAGAARKDETLGFNAGLNYSFAKVWNANLRYDYSKVSSSQSFGKFTHHLVNLNVSCRY